MTTHIDELHTASVLIDHDRLQANITRMQRTCNEHGVQLWPHAKTHKCVEVARMQLAAGASGLVCAKVSEAEALLASGVRRMFLAYPLVDLRLADRLAALAGTLDELMVAATSGAQAEALGELLNTAGVELTVMVGIDSGLGREGARGQDKALELIAFVQAHPRMRLRGLFTHEGQAYGAAPGDTNTVIEDVAALLRNLRARAGEDLELWPGCSVTASRMAAQPGVTAVRPGTYVFGDLSLAAKHRVMQWEDLAATVLTTVVDRPSDELALMDAGSKTLSGDKTSEGIYASLNDGRDVHLHKCSEEHGWATGPDISTLNIGDRVRLVPAHVCPAINLANHVQVIKGEAVVDTWQVDARGCVQ